MQFLLFKGKLFFPALLLMGKQMWSNVRKPTWRDRVLLFSDSTNSYRNALISDFFIVSKTILFFLLVQVTSLLYYMPKNKDIFIINQFLSL